MGKKIQAGHVYGDVRFDRDGDVEITGTTDENDVSNVHNVVNGEWTGVQAGVVYGDITFE